MRVAAIFGPGCSSDDLRPFQKITSGSHNPDSENVEWRIGLPAVSDHVDAVLLFGGDGTIHRHLAPLVKLELPVLVVPSGSGNDFARSLGLRRVRDSLAAWRHFCSGLDNVRQIDLGVISAIGGEHTASAPIEPAHGVKSQYFCCVAGVGLDAEVSRIANRLPRWLRGHGGYALSLLPTIARFAPLAVKISTIVDSAGGTTDDSRLWMMRSNQLTILAAFANTPTYGGGMKIAPRAKLDDGLLDICVVGGVDPFKLFCMFPTVYSGRHLEISEVQYFQAPRVRVETERPIDVYADGEFVCRTPVEVGMERRALRVIGSPDE
jgi:diacylglycerol kinase (ATP)